MSRCVNSLSIWPQAKRVRGKDGSSKDVGQLRQLYKKDFEEGVTLMSTQRNIQKTSMAVMLAGVLLMSVGSGCSQKSSRVYKITYSGRMHQNPDSVDVQASQSPNNQIPGQRSAPPTRAALHQPKQSKADERGPIAVAPQPVPRVIQSSWKCPRS